MLKLFLGERVKKRKSVPAAPPSASRKYMKILRQNTKSGFTKTRCSFCLRQIKIIPLTNHTRRKRVDLRNIQVLGSEVNSITDVGKSESFSGKILFVSNFTRNV